MDLGITGYRICFISQNVQASLKNIDSENDLKSITIGQGFAWADTDILRYNGFNVVEVSNYTSIFNMVANNHVGLFCRGANELGVEYSTYKSIEGLTYDKTFVLFYPLPRFFYVHKKNQLLKLRIEKGLVTAYQDGSIKVLWEKHFLNDLKFANLKQRKLFTLKNPYIVFLPKNYAQYFYNPMK